MPRQRHIMQRDMSRIKLLVLNNLVFAVFIVSALAGMTPLTGACAGAIVLFLPGIGLTMALMRGQKDDLLKLAATVLASSVVIAAGLLAFKLAPFEATRRSFTLYLLVVSNLGLLMPVKYAPLRLGRHYVAVFLISVSALGANAKMMPPIVDQDIGFTLPAYGFVHELKPYMNVSRVPYMLDHQQWPAFVSAASIFLMGELETVRPEYLHAKKLEASYGRDEIWKAWHAIPGTEEYIFENKLALNPKLVFSARVPHFFIAGLLLMVLFGIVRKETSSPLLGWLAVAVAMSPELFVRYSSAGWTPDILYIMLIMCYAYLYHGGARITAFLAAFCAGALISQKTVILPAAIVLADIVRLKGRPGKDAFWSAAGWTAGLGAMALYGYYLNWHCFIRSFLVDHGVVKLVEGLNNVPGFLASWTRGALYMNPVIFFLALAAAAVFTVKKARTRFSVVTMWFWAGALIFTFCIWPNIRNTCLAYIPLVIAMTCFIGGSRAAVRRALTGLVLALFFLNFLLMLKTFREPDFYYGINEVGNTPKTVIYEYYDAMDRLLGGEGKPRAMGRADVAIWSAVGAVFPGSRQVDLRLGKAYLEAGRPAEAIGILEKARKQRPDDDRVNGALAGAYLEAGRYDEAAALYAAVAERADDRSKAYDDLGLAYYLSGRNEEAITAFKKALELDRYNVEALNDLGNAYRAGNRPGEAVLSYKRAIKIRPHNPGLYHNLGNALFEAGRPEEAVAPYRKALSIDRRNTDVYDNLFKVYLALGREEEAADLSVKMTRIVPEEPGPYYNLALYHFRKREYGAASEYYEKARERGMSDPGLEKALAGG